MEKLINILGKFKDKAPQAGSKSQNKTLTQEDSTKDQSKDSNPKQRLQETWKDLIQELTTTDVRFYFLKGEYLTKINKLYLGFSENLDEMGITQRKFIDFIRESFERIKQAQKKLPLEPMNQKFYDYVEKCVIELMDGLKKKFK